MVDTLLYFTPKELDRDATRSTPIMGALVA